MDFDALAAFEGGALALPPGDLILAAGDVLVEWDVELLDQVGTVALDEPGDVFAEVLARTR